MPYRKVKPHPNEKTRRNIDLVLFKDSHPNATYEEIGQFFNGISAARAYQIYKRGKANEPDKTSSGNDTTRSYNVHVPRSVSDSQRRGSDLQGT